MDERTMYLKKTYGKVPKTISSFDEKMIKAIILMKSKYGSSERKCSVRLSETESLKLEKERTVFNKKPSVMASQTHVQKHKENSNVVVCICKATKMNGELCTAKAKPGLEFCGRHLPK